jgi:hypothetical protein
MKTIFKMMTVENFGKIKGYQVRREDKIVSSPVHFSSLKTLKAQKLQCEEIAERLNKAPKNSKIKRVKIIAHRWFDSVNGNTYFSCKIYLNDTYTHTIEMQYGYSDFYLQAARQFLNSNEILSEEKFRELQYKNKIDSFVTDGLKRDMFTL